MDHFFEKLNSNSERLDLDGVMKICPTKADLDILCRKLGESGVYEQELERIPKQYGGKCELVMINQDQLGGLGRGQLTGNLDDEYKKALREVGNPRFVKDSPIFVDLLAGFAKVVAGTPIIHAAMENPGCKYLLAYTTEEARQVLEKSRIKYKKVGV